VLVPDKRSPGESIPRKALREATIVAARREDFRIVHFSIQGNHVHLIAEADSKTALAKGMQASRSPPPSTSTRRAGQLRRDSRAARAAARAAVAHV
jgi:REP element-mobilizing transposase RayT